MPGYVYIRKKVNKDTILSEEFASLFPGTVS